MIRASFPSLGLAALLCGLSSLAVAQQAQQPAQQRSRTVTEPRQQSPATQQRSTTSGAQQRPNGGSAAQQKSGAGSTPAKPGAAPTKPGPGGQGKPGAAAGPGGAQATLLASFGDWGVYATGQGRSKICYALSQPKDRQPKDLKRDPAYLFVSFRPAENVRNEIAFRLGFAARDGAPAEAVIGQATYALVTKGTDAWIRNPAEESQVIAAMMRGHTLTVEATSARGNATTDQYSLSGFTKALERARTECS